MPLISVTVHSIIDYVAGVALLILPLLLGLPASTATVVMQVVGAATIVASLLTAYRLSVLKLIPFRVHLLLDMAMGAVLLVAGLLTLSEGTAAVLLLIAGVIYIVVPLLSRPAPGATAA